MLVVRIPCGDTGTWWSNKPKRVGEAALAMGITYRFDRALGVVIARGEGTVTPMDLASYWKSRIADRKHYDCRRILVDGRSSEIQFSGDDLRRLLNSILKPVTEASSYRIAVLVNNPVQYGTARQFQVFFSGLGVSEIFEDEAAALEWLRQKDPVH